MTGQNDVSIAFFRFDNQIDGLIDLDASNQARFRVEAGQPDTLAFSKDQMTIMTEGLFIRAFSSYELFLEEVFVLYALGNPPVNGGDMNRFIVPRDKAHARDLIKSSMSRLDWNSPDIVISRAETYLDGGPIKAAVVQYKDRLNTIRKIRNSIAHHSYDARREYRKVVVSELRVSPLELPEPGDFLMMTDPRERTKHFLLSYLQVLKIVAGIAAG